MKIKYFLTVVILSIIVFCFGGVVSAQTLSITDIANRVSELSAQVQKISDQSGARCTPKWQCFNWGTCVDNQQIRTCVDIKKCGTNANKPTTSQACTPTKDDVCKISGGKVATQTCFCQNGANFYNTCELVVGMCSCSPALGYEKQIKTCNCGTGKCWNGLGCVALPVDPVVLSCDNLKASPSSALYFDTCRDMGLDKVCFDKSSSIYQSCGKSSYNDCTANNVNADTNIWCDTSATIASCQDIQKNTSLLQNFSSCKEQGFDKVCFNKYSSAYQSCGKSSYNDCTANNANSVLNIWCDSNSVIAGLNKSSPASILNAINLIAQGLQSLFGRR